MREIKFRGWDGKNMRFFDLFDKPRNDWSLEMLMQYTGLKDKTKWEQLTKNEQKEWLEENSIEDWCGKEIYEGDILDICNSRFYVKEALPFISLVDKSGEEYNNGDYYEGYNIQTHDWEDFEVIGNIWEDEEILSDGE